MTVSAQPVSSRQRFTIFRATGGDREPPALTLPQSPQLREQAAFADQRASVDVGLSLLWRELSRGLCKVFDSFFTHDRCFLITRRSTEPAKPLEGRRLQIVEAILCGAGQKSIAIELGVAPSTVASDARTALALLGVDRRPSRAHPLLMLAAQASSASASDLVGSLTFVDRGAVQLRVTSVRRPDARLCEQLPPAEAAVIRALVEGASYREIAAARGTSTRTIANQIASVFRRLNLSGRSDLLVRLFAGESYGAPSHPSARPSLGLVVPPPADDGVGWSSGE